MGRKNAIGTSIMAFTVMVVLILDSRTAIGGAIEGITLCLYTVVPAIFPFLIFSTVINASITGMSLPILRPLGKLCGIPAGCESLLVLGLLGGYPVGALAINNAYKSRVIERKSALRMLGFCNNAGPSFIFGLVAAQFEAFKISWYVWIVHIISAITVGALLPHREVYSGKLAPSKYISLPQALEKSIRTMSSICGWVIAFRVMIAIFERWILWMVPMSYRTILVGFLELTNGCCNLSSIPSESMRFLICCCFLSFGGICILMQTVSVAKDLGARMYLQGKVYQTSISFILAGMLQRFLFPGESCVSMGILVCAAIMTIFSILLLHRKKL